MKQWYALYVFLYSYLSWLVDQGIIINKTNTSFHEINIQEAWDKIKTLITGYEIHHFKYVIICESRILTNDEIIDQRNSVGNFTTLVFTF